jgi:hypothetical protein
MSTYLNYEHFNNDLQTRLQQNHIKLRNDTAAKEEEMHNTILLHIKDATTIKLQSITSCSYRPSFKHDFIQSPHNAEWKA